MFFQGTFMNQNFFNDSNLTEFIGVAPLDTIGLVIASVDPMLRTEMKIDSQYTALGLISSRTGAAGQILAVDEAVKETNTKVLSIDLPRDTKGWGGHGNFIILGAKNVSDAKRAVESALEHIKRYAGEVHINDAGHLEFAYSASAGEAINKAFSVPIGQPFGFMAGSPAAIGLIMADRAVKAFGIKILQYLTPSKGTSHSNEVIIAFTGDTSAVKDAVLLGKKIGMQLLSAMDKPPISLGTPYILE